MSHRRSEQAWNDGRLAYRKGKEIGACPRRSPDQRAKWREGYEHERRIDLAAKITEDERITAAAVARRLREFAQTL